MMTGAIDTRNHKSLVIDHHSGPSSTLMPLPEANVRRANREDVTSEEAATNLLATTPAHNKYRWWYWHPKLGNPVLKERFIDVQRRLCNIKDAPMLDTAVHQRI